MRSHQIRIVIAVLVVANLALFVTGWMNSRDRAHAPPGQAHQPLNAEQIRIVRNEPEPAPPPPVREEVCLEWGPFPQDELVRAQDALAPLRLGERLVVAAVPAIASWWVYIPPRRTKEAADKEVARLNAAGVRDTYVVQEGTEQRYAISLGIFRSEDAATRYADGLRARGIANATVGARQHQIRLSAVYLKSPEDAEAQRVFELKPRYPGTDARVAKCPEPATQPMP
ncbi:MAG: SPOR domain-containing protein [Burkholderiales bacterium]